MEDINNESEKISKKTVVTVKVNGEQRELGWTVSL